MDTIQTVKIILNDVLQLGAAVDELDQNSPLLGAIPELDSMAVVSLITSLEEHFGFVVEDDELDASVFETLGSLVAFVDNKL